MKYVQCEYESETNQNKEMQRCISPSTDPHLDPTPSTAEVPLHGQALARLFQPLSTLLDDLFPFGGKIATHTNSALHTLGAHRLHLAV
jgi:hypothetical protein